MTDEIQDCTDEERSWTGKDYLYLAGAISIVVATFTACYICLIRFG